LAIDDRDFLSLEVCIVNYVAADLRAISGVVTRCMKKMKSAALLTDFDASDLRPAVFYLLARQLDEPAAVEALPGLQGLRRRVVG